MRQSDIDAERAMSESAADSRRCFGRAEIETIGDAIEGAQTLLSRQHRTHLKMGYLERKHLAEVIAAGYVALKLLKREDDGK